MEETMQEGVAVTPNEETAQEPQAEDIFGEAEDGTRYNAESPAVVAYRELFPEVSLEAAIGSVVALHASVVSGETVSEDVVGADRVISIIREGIASEAEAIDDVDEQETDDTSDVPDQEYHPEDDEVEE